MITKAQQDFVQENGFLPAASPAMARQETAALIVRDAAETDPADPHHKDTICINADVLEAMIVERLPLASAMPESTVEKLAACNFCLSQAAEARAELAEYKAREEAPTEAPSRRVALLPRLAAVCMRVADRRPPDFIIGGADDPYLLRWWLIPRNPVFNVYLHCFKRSDDDRARHTHPWLFNLSWLLRNRYREWFGDGQADYVDREAGALKFRWGEAPHRVELTDGDCWTLFITGPRVREWGFLCNRGFVHWEEFTAAEDKGAIGKGCEP